MVQYKYKAKDSTGKIVSGTISANDEVDLHERLKAGNLYLIQAKEKVEKRNTKRLKSNVISEFSRNIGKLVGAGVSLVKALRIISEDESINPEEREVYSRVLKLVRSGMALSEALLEQGDAFPPLFINMIKSAEASGNMDQIAMQMASYYDKEYRLNGKVKSSMTYPKILSVMIILVVAIIMGFVMPQFDSLFASMPELPVSTEILLAISAFVKTRWYVLIGVAFVGYIAFELICSIPKVRYLRDKMLIKMPKIGGLMKIIYTARFARTLSSLYSAGISIINCLQIAKNTIGNAYIEQQFDSVISEIRAGGNLSEAIDKVDGFTKKLSSSVMVGEETGALDTMLVSIADQMEFDSEMALNKLVSYLEPVMIVIMAIIVGFIMISVIQPIYGSYQQISTSY
ncbi:MAG: type II secretion system F family protein [Eubacteriales bacterium]|nr:type II secretion system F family protein [Eubacteriales bacterium]